MPQGPQIQGIISIRNRGAQLGTSLPSVLTGSGEVGLTSGSKVPEMTREGVKEAGRVMTGEGPRVHPCVSPARPLVPGTETQDQVSQELVLRWEGVSCVSWEDRRWWEVRCLGLPGRF